MRLKIPAVMAAVIFTAMTAGYFAITVAAETVPPIPPIPAGAETRITPPDPKLPAEIRVFCGEWSLEKWVSTRAQTVRLSKLYVTRVYADKAEVLYGCGDSLLSPSKQFWFQGIATLRKEDRGMVMVIDVNGSLLRFWMEGEKLVGVNPFLAGISFSKVR
jgi:hypothetical protein